MLGLYLDEIETGLTVDLGAYEFTRENVLKFASTLIRNRSTSTTKPRQGDPSASWRRAAGTRRRAG